MILKMQRDVTPYTPALLLPVAAMLEVYQIWWSFWLPPIAVKCQVLEFKKRAA